MIKKILSLDTLILCYIIRVVLQIQKLTGKNNRSIARVAIIINILIQLIEIFFFDKIVVITLFTIVIMIYIYWRCDLHIKDIEYFTDTIMDIEIYPVLSIIRIIMLCFSLIISPACFMGPYLITGFLDVMYLINILLVSYLTSFNIPPRKGKIKEWIESYKLTKQLMPQS